MGRRVFSGRIGGAVADSLAKTPEAVEEERRLLYVGVTRAKTRLLFHTRNRGGVDVVRTANTAVFGRYVARGRVCAREAEEGAAQVEGRT